MTARKALQAIVKRTVAELRYSPVDLIKAITLLDQMEQRDLQRKKGDGMQKLLDALNTAAQTAPDTASKDDEA